MAIKITGTNTVAAPGITGDDTDTGLVYGTNQVDISTGGSSRVTVDSSGNVGIGTTSPDQPLHVKCLCRFETTNSTNHWVNYAHTDNTYRFNYNGAGNDEMILGSDGKFYFATTSAGPHGGHFNIDSSSSSTNGLNVKGTDGNYVMISSSARNGGHHIYFSNRQSGSDVNTGSISDNNSNVSYNTSSDYRIKENIVSLSDGITRLKQLNPIRHTFKNNSAAGTVDGWIAHELDTVCPYAVVGEKDAVNEDGTDNLQGVDYGRITPLLTAALKEAITKIETLETKVAALEAHTHE